MNMRAALGLVLGVTMGLVAACWLLRKLHPEPDAGEDDRLPLSLEAARAFMKDPDGAMADMMKLWEGDLSDEDRQMLALLEEDDTSPRQR